MIKDSARHSLELDPVTEQRARWAASLAGFETLDRFIEQAILEKVDRVFQEAETITLDTNSFQAFQASCASPEVANEALVSAMQRRLRLK